MRKCMSVSKYFLVAAVIALTPLSAVSQSHSVALGQQVKDDMWSVTCSSSKQIRHPQSVRVMPVGSGLQIVRQFAPSEGFTLFQVGCTVENRTSMDKQYFLKDIHTYSIPEDAFSVIGMSGGHNADDPLFLLTLVNPEIKDKKIAVAAGEIQQIVFLFLAKARPKELRFQFRNLSPYSLEW